MLYEWTKKLGQQHWHLESKAGTFCGMPMMGNNYDRVYTQDQKVPCAECLNSLKKRKLQPINVGTATRENWSSRVNPEDYY